MSFLQAGDLVYLSFDLDTYYGTGEVSRVPKNTVGIIKYIDKQITPAWATVEWLDYEVPTKNNQTDLPVTALVFLKDDDNTELPW